MFAEMLWNSRVNKIPNNLLSCSQGKKTQNPLLHHFIFMVNEIWLANFSNKNSFLHICVTCICCFLIPDNLDFCLV